ncbi:uncharacterized protein BYT42DRAFT_492567 [Radiomyces spectabilis]|uniref:uncharacterized protein n=1 Tax=Radiomyces spectabilis TaxID=64574 RepID=UPI00221F6C94|nr:uncharacterized protein BYT42DRAFT_492567 [Radiomyces spectabilis]KAI8384597.1 hypothetical protein BYT42DRAFT_492567 [Radiomyces spectabilis]
MLGFVCPFCHEELGLPLPYKVDRALNLIKAKDREFANQSAIAAGESVNNASFRARHIQYKRPVDDREEERFCRLHRIELKIKPQGRRKGYPLHIAFEDLEERIQGFRQELMDVIAGRVHSSYRETALKAYKDLGTNKARSVMGVMARFETTLPGYYGSKGAAIILDILNSMFLQTGLLGKEQTSPQLPMEYLQQVLVPEVGYRLIRQDIINHSKHTPQDLTSDETEMSLAERAKIIMSESSEFGSLIHPGADDQDEVLDISDDSQNEEKDTNNIANHSDDGSLDPNASDRSDDPDHESQTVISCSEDEEKDSEDDSTNDERTEDDNASPSELDRLENIPTVAPPPNKKPSVLIISDSSSDDEP